MECERFKRLLKSWYSQVQNEALAPARMVDFMETHISECPTCMMDPEARKDMTKIITLVLPQDKLKTASRSARKTDPDAPVENDAASKANNDDEDDSIKDETDDDIDADDDEDDIDEDDDI